MTRSTALTAGLTIALVDEREEKQSIPAALCTSVWYQKLSRALIHCVSDAPSIPLTIIYADPSAIRLLNATYRKRRRVTDVLSFTYTNDDGDLSEGEIVICPAQALRQRHRFHTTVRQEFARLFFHGLLHIYGYDHIKPSEQKQMRSSERCLMNYSRI